MKAGLVTFRVPEKVDVIAKEVVAKHVKHSLIMDYVDNSM